MCRMCAPHRRAKHSKTRSRDFLKIATTECDDTLTSSGPKVRTSLDSSLLHMEPAQCRRDRTRHQATRDLHCTLLRMPKLRWFGTHAHQKSGASCSKTHSGELCLQIGWARQIGPVHRDSRTRTGGKLCTAIGQKTTVHVWLTLCAHIAKDSIDLAPRVNGQETTQRHCCSLTVVQH